MKLSELIQQEEFQSPSQEALLNVVVTGSWILSEMAAVMAPYGVTPAQYNVLRILQGNHPKTLTCSALGQRLLDRTPDVTRLLNRLERHDLICRARAEHDRRVVEVGITEAGLALLERMREAVEAAEQRLTGPLSPSDHQQLCCLLERLRADQQT